MSDLKGKRGLIVGIANHDSIAYGCAKAMHEAGAELAITYLNAKAEAYVRPLAESLNSSFVLPCDVEQSGQLEAVFSAIQKEWGTLDFLVHAIAYAPKEDLHGRLVDCSADGFARAMYVSCHSFIRMAKLAEPLMVNGGTLMTMTYLGSQHVVRRYGVMGPVKAALESTVKYMAAELGEKGIRVHAISPGPIQTRAASGIPEFSELLEESKQKSPAQLNVTIEDVGYVAAMLASDGAKSLTGNTVYVDAGYHIMG
jgi:enoyl-[acyl-carrier protein] reductase I